jgi:UDP:flavonoid glycosyltransferase YjiC (YdhE family)
VSPKQRLLFVAENVTLAQVVRLVTLARALDPEQYELHFACSDFPELVFEGTRFHCHPLATLAAEVAERALQAGRRLYEKPTLLRYIDAEMALIRAVRPAFVIGDFRLSLPTSAELCGVPSAVLINAYWSPFARRGAFPVPDHPIVKWLGEGLTEQYFPQAIPRVFQHFANPVNAARKKHGLPPVGSLLQVLTHADYTLYPDDPWLTPLELAPPNHRFLGPVFWQPELSQKSSSPLSQAALQSALEQTERPLVYVTLGSSGDLRLLPMILVALAKLPVTAIVATAGRVELRDVPPNVVALPFVRGSEVARRARVVVSNGGSTTGYQALGEGTPVVGIPSNFDQYLATQAIVAAGAGVLIKARQASADNIEASLALALRDTEMQAAARRIAERFASHDSGAAFRSFVGEVLAAGRHPPLHAPQHQPRTVAHKEK